MSFLKSSEKVQKKNDGPNSPNSDQWPLMNWQGKPKNTEIARKTKTRYSHFPCYLLKSKLKLDILAIQVVMTKRFCRIFSFYPYAL